MNSRTLLSTSIIAGSVALAAQVSFAQTSELYLTDVDDPRCFVVQDGSIVRSFNRVNTADGPGLVVQDTIKMIGQDPGQTGFEYDTDGNMLSGSYTNPGYDSLYDGATDGVKNWTIAHNDFDVDFAVLKADADWQDMEILFVPERRSSGITYDANNDSLWITNNIGGVDRVQQFDLAGNLISEFNAVHSGGGYGIAWDPADDTLWIPGAYGTASQLFQYDKSGNLLQSFAVSGLPGRILGAEFGPADEDGLTIESTDCPGTVQVTAGGAQQGNRVYFIYGTNEGEGPQVPGCPGVRVGILGPTIAGFRIADANGEATISGQVGSNACGRIKVQAVEPATCELSDVITL